MSKRLHNKTAIVTGASSGIGKAIAELYAAEGANVVALARRKERLDELAEAAGESGGIILPFQADVRNQNDIDAAIDFTVEKFGRLDIAVNNAGVMDDMCPAGDVTDELWEKVIETNLTSLMRLYRSALRVMLPQGDGVLLTIASIAGIHGCRGGAAYTASKFGAVGYTKNIGYMYAKEGIRCNAICPGGVDTEIALNMKQPSAFGYGRVSTGRETNPRLGKPEEIAAAAVFLASEESSFVNGAALMVDGGFGAF
jgi:NAD(P)-dependent dehydrogenase (short-subunit alcohol dehydrogenase family)